MLEAEGPRPLMHSRSPQFGVERHDWDTNLRGGAVPVADVVAPPELQEGNTVAAMIALLLLSAWVLLYLAGYF